MEGLHPDIQSIILGEDDIRKVIERLGREVSRDYADKSPLIVAVLRGAFVFTADLMRAITVPCSVDFMAVSSYGDGVKSSGVVRIVKDLDTKIEGRHVLIAEDILDSGLTLSYLIDLLQARRPVRPRGNLCRQGHRGKGAGHRPTLRWRPCSQRVHRGLRPRLRGEIPQPALHWHPQA